MVKRKIVEVIEEYDENEKLVKKTTTETTEDDDTPYVPYYPSYPSYPVYPWQNPVTYGGNTGDPIPQGSKIISANGIPAPNDK